MLKSVLLGAALVVAAPAAQAQGEAPRINWSLFAANPPRDASQIQLTIQSRWDGRSQSSWSNTRNISDLQGLSAAQLSGPPQPARFVLVRDAGRLDCSGTVGGLTGSGFCTLTPDASFVRYLAAHGIRQPDERGLFSLTMSGAGRELIEAMDHLGYVRPTIDQLAAMGIHGVAPAFVRGLATSGYRLRSADDLVAFKIHGVDLDYIRGMAAAGQMLQHLPADDLVSLRIHGVKPAYVQQMAAIGPEFRSLTADSLVSFAIHGVRPELVQAYVRANHRPVRTDDVVSMAIHGVDAGFINAMAALGYRDLAAEDLITLRIHGVTPDYVQSLQRAGMSHLSADQLVKLRLAGFDGRSN